MARSSSCACRRWTQWQQTGRALSVKLWQITRPQKIPPKICWYSILFKCLELTSSSTQRHPQSEHCSVSIAATSRSPEASYSIVSPFSVLADPVWRLWNQIKLYNITIYVLSMFLAKEVASDGCQSLTYFHRWLVKRISLEPACPAWVEVTMHQMIYSNHQRPMMCVDDKNMQKHVLIVNFTN